MLRIQDDTAAAGMAALAMAKATLKTGDTESASAALTTAENLFKRGLEPSRAERGAARPDSPRTREKGAGGQQRAN